MSEVAMTSFARVLFSTLALLSIVVSSSCGSYHSGERASLHPSAEARDVETHPETAAAQEKRCTRWDFLQPFIRFGPDDVELDEEDRQLVRELGAMIIPRLGRDLAKVHIDGYSFREPSQSEETGRTRAALLKNALVEQGIPATLIDIEGHNGPAPFYQNELTGEVADVDDEDVRIARMKLLFREAGSQCIN